MKILGTGIHEAHITECGNGGTIWFGAEYPAQKFYRIEFTGEEIALIYNAAYKTNRDVSQFPEHAYPRVVEIEEGTWRLDYIDLEHACVKPPMKRYWKKGSVRTAYLYVYRERDNSEIIDAVFASEGESFLDVACCVNSIGSAGTMEREFGERYADFRMRVAAECFRLEAEHATR